HNQAGTEYDRDLPGLVRFSRQVMRAEPMYLSAEQALVAADEFLRTATFRHWELSAVAVMANHVHLVVVVAESNPGEKLLQEFKSYASRALNQRFGRPPAGTWWTRSGSKRRLPDDAAVPAAMEYLRI